ncbi:hypothetical protein MNV49_001037 [Pseudohyphozyma bogoriensis]|nr:hypothetical protein MNV49_001037 [Pseudohyphozyma bogoriensis]
MIIPATSYVAAYNDIVDRSRGTNSATTFILVSPDVDAIAAAHLLHDMLTTQNIPLTIIPVASWPEMINLRDRFEGEDVRSLIFINLGGMVDLLYYFSYLPPTCIMHVIDSHRPTNLANLYTPSAYATALFDPKRPRHAARKDDHLPEPELSVVVWDDAEGDDESREAEKEAHLALMPRPLTKMQRRRYRARRDKYYSATFTGQSVANQVFLLAVLSASRMANEDGVWLAILGLTHQFTTNQIDRSRYDAYVKALADEVARLSPLAVSRTIATEPNSSTGASDRSIQPSEELRFCLFRHWNLYDAMMHSGYVASRMKLWKERGQKNLSGMLAKMGYSLLQAHESYEHMDAELKKDLYRNMEQLAPEYGLDDLNYQSFIRKSGHSVDISAHDAVEGLGALLEVATGVRLDFGNRTMGGGAIMREEWGDGIKGFHQRNGTEGREVARAKNQEEEEEDEEEKYERKGREEALRNFWLTWDALSPDTTLLRSSLKLAMALHRSVTGQGTYILDKGAIQSFRTYRLAIIKEGPYLDIFRHPATLLRLANWLVDAVRDLVGHGTTGKTRIKSLPFVLASLDQTTDRYLVVGIIGAVEYGDVKKNSFGIAFQHAAAESRAQTKQDSFEASVIEVKKDDLPKFLKLLAIG